VTDVKPRDVDWSLTSFEGNRRAQLRRNLRLTLRERLQAVEDMAEMTRVLQAAARPRLGV